MKVATLAILVAVLACSAFATTSTDTLNALCIQYIAQPDTPTPSNMGCMSYVKGVTEEMDGELVTIDGQKYATGNWAENVSFGQVIRVFVKYVTANPETLNKPAFLTIRASAVASGLYAYTAFKAPVIPSNN